MKEFVRFTAINEHFCTQKGYPSHNPGHPSKVKDCELPKGQSLVRITELRRCSKTPLQITTDSRSVSHFLVDRLIRPFAHRSVKFV